MASILILGGGFGGLITAERLAASLPAGKHQITLVSQKPEFVFYPALVQVAFGRFEPEDIRFDLAGKLADSGIRFVRGEVISINAEKREAQIYGDDFDGKLRYDYLIIALGRRLATEKAPGFFEYAHHILDTGAALRFGEAVKSFKEGEIVVGMCPGARLPVPACEAAFALARRFEREISEKKISISIVFPETVEAAFGGAKIGYDLDWAFEKHDVRLITNFAVKEIAEKQIVGRDGQTMNFDLLMLVPPFRGQALLSRMREGATDESGYVKVNGSMQVNNLPHAYAVGDIVAFSGPKLAHMAVRQARIAAENVISEISGEAPNSEYYHEIATIIDEGESDTIFLHYGIWDKKLYRLQQGTLWSWVKSLHDRYWRAVHSN